MKNDIILDRINRLLEEAGCGKSVSDIKQLQEFVNDDDNKKLEVYDEIEELYAVLMLGPGMW